MKMYTNQFWTLLLSLTVVLSISLSSCDTVPMVGECDFSTKKVIQDSRNGFVTFAFEIPEEWISSEDEGYRSVKVFSENMADSVNKSNAYDLILGISCYRESTGDLSFAERMNAIEELLNGNGQPYEEFTKKNTGTMDNEITADDFEFQLFKGQYGKIAAVKYTVTYPNKYNLAPQRMIRCYRKDIPYMFTGVFHEDDTLSSGDVALWVTNTLTVTEHFTMKDGKMIKK